MKLFAEAAYVSLYYDSRSGAECVNRLLEKVKAALEEALAAVEVDGKTWVSADCRKYINIIWDGHGTKIGLNQELLQEEFDGEGFSSLASSEVMTADEKDAVYRLRRASGE